MIQPHGGSLINKELPKREKERILGQIDEFNKIQVNPSTLKVIKNIGFGVFSPLEGFMGRNDYLYVLDHMYTPVDYRNVDIYPLTLCLQSEDYTNYT